MSVNEEERQSGMLQRWGLSSMQLVSDPGGDSYLKALDLYNAEERGGIAVPAMLVIDPDGNEVYRYQGRDFADRTTDDDVYAAIDALGLDAVSPEPSTASVDVSDDLRGFFPRASFVPYFSGNKFGAIAIGGRLPDKETAAIAREHRLMAEASLEAWDAHKDSLTD